MRIVFTAAIVGYCIWCQCLEHGQQTVNNRKSFLKYVSRFQSERKVAHWKLLSKEETPLQLLENVSLHAFDTRSAGHGQASDRKTERTQKTSPARPGWIVLA